MIKVVKAHVPILTASHKAAENRSRESSIEKIA
jgi:hypothetical protein